MQDGYRTSRPRRGSAWGVVGLVVTALALAGCTATSNAANNGSGGGSAGNGSPASTTTANPASIAITPAASEQINPNSPIIVKITDGTLDTVTVTNPAKGTQVTGSLSADKTTWQSNEQLAYGTAYQVDAQGTSKDGQATDQKGTVTTLTPASTVYPNLIPGPSIASVGVGQIIAVKFDKPITDKAAAQKSLQLTSTPTQTGGWYWVSSSEVHYRPQVYWQAGTTINLHIGIYGVDLGGGVYGQTDRDVTYHVHDSWIAKADGATEQMQIFHNGALVNTMPISMGKDATPTHIGPHVISNKQNPYIMDSCSYGVCPPNPQAYRATEYFDERISNDGEFVHENPNSVAQQGHTNVSHGCINLSPANAQWFFNNFNIGDVVEVANSGGPQLPLYDTWGDWELSWSDWLKGSAL